ncbi:putative SET domain, rubisco LSMT, substrate-binding domain superfamily [Septoria linicola]|nr:putative SET domain, rubisco LSMT, substrate-binding domain superfamily [Septoria linicola]
MEPMDIDDFQSATDTFLTWLKNNGATISPNIQLADLRDRAAGRGVVATKDIAEDEELFSIPRASILTTETSDLPANVRKEIDHPWLSLILVMVYEYLKSTDSSWKPYFDLLPEQFDSLMFWSDDELQLLEGSAVVEKIGKETADSTFSEQLIPIIAQHADVFKTGGRSNDELLALCHRMGSTIMAYAFDLEKPESEQSQRDEEEWEEDEESATLPKGMVPLADMLNADADRNNAKLFYEDDKVVMKTIKAVKAGEELYNDFGSLPRADLIRRYGYVTENYAKYDLVEISSDLIKEQAKVQLRLVEKDVSEKWQYAEEQGVGDDAYDISRAGNEEGQFPEELCVALNLLATPKAEFEKLKKKDKLPKADLTTDAKKLLRAVLVHRYAAYPKEVAAAQTLTGRIAMAKQVIDGEKQVLQEAVAAVTDANNNKKRSADTLEDEVDAIRQPSKR